MLTHLKLFFDEEGIVAKFIEFIYILTTKAKDLVLDHITFTFIRKMMVDACVHLCNNPLAPILKENMDSRTEAMIERLIKPTTFTNNLKKKIDFLQKRRWGLNDNSDPHTHLGRRFTPHNFAQGYGRVDVHG